MDILEETKKCHNLEASIQSELEQITITFGDENITLTQALFELTKIYGTENKHKANKSQMTNNLRNVLEHFQAFTFKSPTERMADIEQTKANIEAQKETLWEQEVIKEARAKRDGIRPKSNRGGPAPQSVPDALEVDELDKGLEDVVGLGDD